MLTPTKQPIHCTFTATVAVLGDAETAVTVPLAMQPPCTAATAGVQGCINGADHDC